MLRTGSSLLRFTARIRPLQRRWNSRSILDNKIKGLAADLRDSNPWTRRRALARAITLVESTVTADQAAATLLLQELLQCDDKNINNPDEESSKAILDNGNFRLGLAGAPGAGKSTFLEAFGEYILNLPMNDDGNSGNENDSKKYDNNPSISAPVWAPSRLAVLCVDPSSPHSGGSILGDKTRMTNLSSGALADRAYVRPTPSQGRLGGLAGPATAEAATLCHAAGFPLVVVETVGIGQGELDVSEAVDMVLLLVPPGNGDDLQGIKKGILEVADALVVTKADGNLEAVAQSTAADYRGAMQFHASSHISNSENSNAHPPWQPRPPVLLCSSFTGRGLAEIWQTVCDFRSHTLQTGRLAEKRGNQRNMWMWKHLWINLEQRTQQDPGLRQAAQELERELRESTISPRLAARRLLDVLSTT